jgi:hypothetical protein
MRSFWQLQHLVHLRIFHLFLLLASAYQSRRHSGHALALCMLLCTALPRTPMAARAAFARHVFRSICNNFSVVTLSTSADGFSAPGCFVGSARNKDRGGGGRGIAGSGPNRARTRAPMRRRGAQLSSRLAGGVSCQTNHIRSDQTRKTGANGIKRKKGRRRPRRLVLGGG